MASTITLNFDEINDKNDLSHHQFLIIEFIINNA